MKKILLSITASFLFLVSIAVPIKSGTYNVTSGSTANVQLTDLSFVTVNSIGSAIDLLNANGVDFLATVEFDFADGYTETSTNNYAGGYAPGNFSLGGAGSALLTSTYTAVIFKHNGTGVKPVLTASTTGTSGSTSDYFIRILGADNITFDGIDLNESTLHTTNNTTMEYGYYLLNSSGNGAQNNTIKNCKISLYNYSASAIFYNVNSIGIVQINTDLTTTNSGNIYTNDTITKAYAGGIRIRGINTSLPDVGCQITNCVVGTGTVGDIGSSIIHGAGSAVVGIEAAQQNDITIHDNTVQNIQYYRTGNSVVVYGIWLDGCGGTISIYKNQVIRIINQRVSSTTGSSTAGLQLNIVPAGTVNVYNNFIGAIQLAGNNSTTSALYGIRAGSSSFTAGGTLNFYHNTVYLPSIPGSQLGTSANIYIYQVGSASVKIIDNLLKNSISGISGSSKTYCIYLGSGNYFTSPASSSSNYNILDIAPSGTTYYTGNYLGTDKSTFANWQASASNDANSKQFVTTLTSVTDLHLVLPAPDPNYTGTSISSPSITTDIDGETRLYPHIGADEKVFTIAPQVVISTNNPSDSLVSLNSTNNLLAGISLNVSGVANTLTGITFTTAGLYTTSGLIDFTNVTLWYSSSSVFSPGTSTVLDNTTYAVTMPALGANNLSFTGLSLTLPLGATYLYVTFNVPLNATAGHNVRVTSTPFANITFGNASTTKIGTNPVPQGGLQTIAQYYYNYANVDITDESSWYENVTGLFQPPSNFTDPNQVFVFIANTGSTMGSVTSKPSWNVSGTNTKIWVGDGTTAVIVEAKLPIVTGTGVVMDIRDKGTVKFQSSYTPTTLGTLSLGTASTPGSTVEYGDTTVTVTIDTVITASYCNLTLSGTTTGGAKRNIVSNISVARSFLTGGFPGATLGTITFNGGLVTQVIPTGFTFRGLRTNNSIGATTLAGNVQVDSLLRFTTNLNITAGQILTLGANANVFAPNTTPTFETGKLNLTGTGIGAIAALTNTNPLTTTFLGSAAALNTYIVFGPYSNYNLSATLSSTVNNYGQIPPATWDATSTINISNVTTAGANNIVIGYPFANVLGNFTFDAPSLAADYRPFGGINNLNNPGVGSYATPFSINIQGNCTLGKTGTGTIYTVDLGAGTAAQSSSINVTKKLTQSDGIYRLINSASGSNQKVELTVSDDITLSNATQLIINGAATVNNAVRGTVYAGANFTANSGTTVTELGTSNVNNIVFTKAGTQILTTNGANFNNDINYIINNGSTTQLGTSSNLTVNTGAYINLLTGGIFDIAAANTLSINGLINTGATQGTFSGTATSNLLLGGTATGSMGTAYFTSGSAVLNNLTLNRGVAAAPSVVFGGTTGLTVHGTIAIGTGTNTNNTIDMGVNALSAGGSFATNIAATGTLKTQNTTATPIPTGKTWGGTVWYSSASAQTMVDGSFTNINGTGGSRTLSSTGTIGIAGANTCFTTGSSSYTVTGSTVDFNGSANQNIPAFTFENVISSNGSTTKILVGNIAVQESMTLSNTTTLQLDNFNVSLVSTAAKTARLNPVTTAAKITYTGSGLVFPQRYLPARRAWRLMSAPIDPAFGTHTISEAWQEGGTDYTLDSTNVPVNGGFATQITGGTIANGFDQTATSSIKYFNAGSWVAAANTNSLSVNSKEGWFLFVRGDRKNFGVITNQYKTPTNTTLRPRGRLLIGTKSITSVAGGLTVIGNPYASAIDYNSMTRTGAVWPANPTYYMWDPYLGGATGQGAFITLTWNGSVFVRSAPLTGSGTSTIDNRYIPSGAAILVNFPAGGTLTFNETDKNAANTTVAFRSANNQLMTVLNTITPDNETYVSDAALSLFDDRFSNGADINDAIKLSSGEGISIKTQGAYLSVERRKLVGDADTIFYNMSRMQQKKYQLQFILDKINAPSATVAFLEDLYLKTKTVVSMQDTSYLNFTVTSDAASAATDRFRLIFKRSVTYTSIHAAVVNSDIAVNWNQQDELNINHYDIERSINGVSFTSVGTKLSNGDTNAPVSYNWLDASPAPGVYYYRIKSVSNNGVVTYSETAKVKIVKTSPALYVFPNPVTDGNIQLQLNSAAAGLYSTRLLDNNGQLVHKEIVVHAGGTSTHVIKSVSYLTGGTYQLEVTSPDKKVTVIQIAVNKK